MNILLVSQCSKNALAETRRILDQFAERYGTRTWQTQITQQGLMTLRTLLKRTARRNTAVACHWVRGKNRTELMWIVGNASAFSEKGTVPTNTSERDILRQQDENDWHTLQEIKILAAIAALFHDFGKANEVFQAKLLDRNKKDAYRHEWISLRLFEAFVGNSQDDADWLSRLASLNESSQKSIEKTCLESLIKDGCNVASCKNPFVNMPPLAKAVGWLIVSHHGLLSPAKDEPINPKLLDCLLRSVGPSWNRARVGATAKDKQACWKFKHKLPLSSQCWQARANYWAKEALKHIKFTQRHLYSLHLARLSLMLADHYYSSLPARAHLGDADFELYANTDNEGKLKQRLDEHLIGVAKYAKQIATTLPLLTKILPRIARHKGFKRRAIDARFRWQDQAYDLACSIRERTVSQGFFGINMASTGCGKTFANGRIMYGLANPQTGARFSIALGLRTLTLQTGKAYRDRLALGDDDLAILVGSTAVRKLFELANSTAQTEQRNPQSGYGSESAAELMDDNTYVHFEGSLAVGGFDKWLQKTPRARALLAAPILVCTIDHLMGATEGIQGGKQIAPMLRLLTADLVLDEPDDFGMDDLPALARLVHWAGMLGSRVLLSSATLPPALIEGLFNAYKEGRAEFQKCRGVPGQAVNVCCAWFDEYQAVTSEHGDSSNFAAAHQQFVAKRVKKLQTMEVRRRAVIKPLTISTQEQNEVRQQVASAIHEMLYPLHQHHHSVAPVTQKRVSFGLVRMANIDPLIDISQHLLKMNAQPDYQIKFCCYHSRHPLLIRNHIENNLDRLLARHQPEAVFKDCWLREVLAGSTANNIILVVLASPVAEVGRDHDYDWAIVEPSSMRSIIQLAGRIRRHRAGTCTEPNLYLLGNNIKSLECRNVATPVYCKPGYEKKGYELASHDLAELLRPQQYEIISAQPRIQVPENLAPKQNLSDLEHQRMQALMLSELGGEQWPVSCWWTTEAALAGVLQRKTRFRKSKPQKRFAYVLSEEGEPARFYNISGEIPKEAESVKFQELKIEKGQGSDTWAVCENYSEEVYKLAEQLGIEDIQACSQQFGWVDLPENVRDWCYNPAIGLRRKDR